MIVFAEKLIRIKSLSGEEKEAAELVFAELKKLKYDETYIDDWGNIVGIVRGDIHGKTIMYNGHIDIVTEGNLSEWENYKPYDAVIDKAKIFNRERAVEEITEVIHGRGSSDMKCGLASQIYAGAVLAEMKRGGIKWKGNFLLAAVTLEENGEAMGTIKLVEGLLKEKNIPIDGMISAEPSSLDIKLGHRGRMEIKIIVHGKSCHGSSPWLGVNAVEKAAKLIVRVEEFFAKKKDENEYLGKPSIALTIIECEPAALCIIPDKCLITYDRRLIPGETIESALAEMESIVKNLSKEDKDFKADVRINKNIRRSYTDLSEEIESKKPVWIINRDHPFVEASARGLEEAGQEVRFGYWSFSTDIPQIGTIMKKPCIGYSAGQELYIHNENEKVRLDYFRQSLDGNISIYLKISELPKDAFDI
jgi:putative selenium metabolism hydrolase